jgi:hypothetical protein
MKLILSIFIISFLTSCSNVDKRNSNDKNELYNDSLVIETEVNNKKELSEKLMEDQFVFIGDSVILPEFEIEIKLSENAEKKLKTDKESIIVQAYFSGIPIDTTMADYIKWGKISIGSYRIELFDKRIARFENVKISKDEFQLLSDKNFEVLINVFTGRRTTSSNLLNTDILQDGIETIKAKKHILKGKLIYGD